MIKVLLQVPNTKGWIGGLNYFINLCSALESEGRNMVMPVILGENVNLPHPLNKYSNLIPEEYRIVPLSRFNPLGILTKLLRRTKGLTYRDAIIRTLLKNDIALFSHGFPLGPASPIPSLCWIPDFQHRHLPQFFSKTEIEGRDKHQQKYAEEAQAMLFSSYAALSDFNRFYPQSKAICSVLHFVAIPDFSNEQNSEAVLCRYQIREPYFHLPNQLWAHKNHQVVLDALRILKDRGACPLVISTGFKEDHRDPSYPERLIARVAAAGLDERFRFLGGIAYNDVFSLMKGSLALINPSLFEGWSTTVEEGKSLGKTILLSDIPVHREQAPLRGRYFDSTDPAGLADMMRQVLDEYDPRQEDAFSKIAAMELPGRVRQFAWAYEDIVKNVLAVSGRSSQT